MICVSLDQTLCTPIASDGRVMVLLASMMTMFYDAVFVGNCCLLVEAPLFWYTSTMIVQPITACYEILPLAWSHGRPFWISLNDLHIFFSDAYVCASFSPTYSLFSTFPLSPEVGETKWRPLGLDDFVANLPFPTVPKAWSWVVWWPSYRHS